MAPGPSSRKEVIDLLSSEDEDEASSCINALATGKRSRDASAAAKNDHTAKKTSKESPLNRNDNLISKTQEQPQHCTCMAFIANEDNAARPDSAVVTENLMPLLHRLYQSNIRTCSGRNQSPSAYSSLLHIQQTDRWSCGFRNLQMMLTVVLPHLSASHKFYQCVPAWLGPYTIQQNRPIPIPSLHQLQVFLQESWRDGFDERGAQHYNHSIVGTSREIGAVEASSILSFLYVDSTVIQFIKCNESRALLGPFVWNYFAQGPCFTCHGNDNTAIHVSCSTWAKHLLQDAATRTNDDALMSDLCSCPVIPLYLQWPGHSVTIVGIEKNTNDNVSFLIFDPLKKGSTLQQALAQLNPKDALNIMRLSAGTLLTRNCQVVMCWPRELNERERNDIRECNGHIVTAAQEAVARFCQEEELNICTQS